MIPRWQIFAQGDPALAGDVNRLGNVPYYVLGGYLVLLLLLGLFGWLKSQNTEEDYYLAGRGQGWLVSSLTIMATFFSSFALLGAPGMVYREGVVFALFSLNVPVAGLCVYLLGSRIWKIGREFGYVTPADMIADYYGSKVSLRLLVALAGFLYAIPYIVMQIKAGGLLSEKMFPEVSLQLLGHQFASFEVGCALLSAITMLYIMIGGMRSVAWTDLIQGLLLISGMLISGFAMFTVFGGAAEFSESVVTELPKSSLTVPGNTGGLSWSKLFTICVLASAGSMVQPAQWMRFYAARSVATLRRGAVIFCVVLTSCFILGVMLIGLAGQVLYPLGFSYSSNVANSETLSLAVPDELQDRFTFTPADPKKEKPAAIGWQWTGKNRTAMSEQDKQSLLSLSELAEYRASIDELYTLTNRLETQDGYKRPTVQAHPKVVDFNSILVVVLQNELPAAFGNLGLVFASLIIVAIMAASMSTADSNLHALSAVATRDVFDRFINPSASEKTRLWFGRLVIAAATVVALGMVFVSQNEELKTKYDFMNMIATMGFMAIGFSGQLLPITIDVLFLRKGSGAGAACGLAAGLFGAFMAGPLFKVAVDAIGNPEPLAGLVEEINAITGAAPMEWTAWGLVLNVPIFVLVSLVTRKPDATKVARFEEVVSR